MEGQIGWFRRNHFVPVPEVDSLELNQMIDRWDEEGKARRIRSRPRTIGELFDAERPPLLLAGRPAQPDQRPHQPPLGAGPADRRMVQVVLHTSELVVFDGREVVARHERLGAKGGRQVDLDHYLEALVRKPGALPGATALEQARAAGEFTPVDDARWAAASKLHGDREGARALIDVLLNRQMNHEHIAAGIAAALRVGALTADAVALAAHMGAEADDSTDVPAPDRRHRSEARFHQPR
ncbi:hypothetical protein [Actinomadura sp. NAK00032]|uniref:hypothetical protein n=1 Tax=Actinomadura sp. NAK00032 TaxID=2742128 RepID=UPI001C377EA9|nr:hypothetical protein [Actinomadura sp. NAK00032]